MNNKLSQDIFKGKDKKWQWAAIDGVNSIPTLFTHKPKKSKLFDFYMDAEGEYQDLREEVGYSTENWEYSLIEREPVDKITKEGLQKDIELLESGIAMNWSDMKKIETRLNHEMYGMQIKLNELHLQLEGQQRQIHLAAESVVFNKQAIVRIEDKDKTQIKATTKSVWGLDGTKWGFAMADFQKPLIEREAEVELTGSELCKSMLARGDKAVLCLVGNITDCFCIRDFKDFQAITSVKYYEYDNEDSDGDDGGWHFLNSKNEEWQNAVPINNQGVPLTAKDVGII